MPYKDKNKQKKWQSDHYQSNKNAYRTKLLKRRQEMAEWLLEIKKGLKCERCGESHPACLDFHHRDSNTKVECISRMVRDAYAKESVLEEMEKCEVICANCHRKEHFYKKMAA